MVRGLPIISTFSGGGFLDMGFMKEGFQVQEAFEIEPSFITAYNSGISSFLAKSTSKNLVNIVHHNIDRPIDISSIAEQKLIGAKHKGNVEGLIGGPPCQDYSIGGKNTGVTGDRGKLIYSYLNLIKATDPNFIFFENVSGLYNTKTHQLAFFDLVTKLEKEYMVWYNLFNALDYGIPQDRSRLLLVGFKKDIVERLIKHNYRLLTEDKQSDNLVFKWPVKNYKRAKKQNWPQVWEFGTDIIQADVNNIPKKYIELSVIKAFEGISEKDMNQNECFVPYSKKFKEINEGDTYRKSFKRLHRYRYSPTVAYGNNEVHLHPTEPRRLTVREALRLQTVPDSYILPPEVTLTSKYKLISNGVPTKKAQLFAKEIRRTMDNYYATFKK